MKCRFAKELNSKVLFSRLGLSEFPAFADHVQVFGVPASPGQTIFNSLVSSSFGWTEILRSILMHAALTLASNTNLAPSNFSFYYSQGSNESFSTSQRPQALTTFDLILRPAHPYEPGRFELLHAERPEGSDCAVVIS